jgi:PAS domain-containing protein
MTSTASMLVHVSDRALALRCQSLLEDGGAQVQLASNVADCVAILQSGRCDALLLRADDEAPAEVLARANDLGVPMLLATVQSPDPTELHRALELGCVGVLAADASAAAVAALLQRVAARSTALGRAREENRRLRFQSEDARRRWMREADRHREAQETFYLDLSRLMNIITNIMDGIVFVDRGGNVALMNPVAEDLLGAKAW